MAEAGSGGEGLRPPFQERTEERIEDRIEKIEWIEIPIPLPAEGRNEIFEVGGLALLLCNAAGTPYVVRDECPHVKTSLQGGLIKGTILECPLHGGLLDLRDGRPVAMPIRRPVTCYPVRSAGTGWQVGIPVGLAREGPLKKGDMPCTTS